MGRKTPRRIHALFRATASEPGFILCPNSPRMGQALPRLISGGVFN